MLNYLVFNYLLTFQCGQFHNLIDFKIFWFYLVVQRAHGVYTIAVLLQFDSFEAIYYLHNRGQYLWRPNPLLGITPIRYAQYGFETNPFTYETNNYSINTVTNFLWGSLSNQYR